MYRFSVWICVGIWIYFAKDTVSSDRKGLYNQIYTPLETDSSKQLLSPSHSISLFLSLFLTLLLTLSLSHSLTLSLALHYTYVYICLLAITA